MPPPPRPNRLTHLQARRVDHVFEGPVVALQRDDHVRVRLGARNQQAPRCAAQHPQRATQSLLKTLPRSKRGNTHRGQRGRGEVSEAG